MHADNHNNIKLTGDQKDILVHGDVFYKITPLQDGEIGGNSTVLTCVDPNDDTKYAVKFSNLSYSDQNKGSAKRQSFVKKRLKRFSKEIEALKIANSESHPNVVEFFDEGIFKSNGKEIPYYIMEFCETNLTTYLLEEKIPFNQKLILSIEIIKGIQELHRLELYHRDIKPDNIFMSQGVWKIGDLGLSIFQDDFSLDGENEKIGPYGWLSPEVMNKVLCKGTPLENQFQCVVNSLSDIFQLGKLLWFIFLGNIPIGQIIRKDFITKPKDECDIIFSLLFNMLQYNPQKRWNLKKAETCILDALKINDKYK